MYLNRYLYFIFILYVETVPTLCQTWKKFQSFRRHDLPTNGFSQRNIAKFPHKKLELLWKSSFIGCKYNKYLRFIKKFLKFRRFLSTIRVNNQSKIQKNPQFPKISTDNVRASTPFSMSALCI